MKPTIILGRIYGIEIGLHYSWLIIAVLISLSLSRYFSEAHPDWSGGTIWAMSLGTAILFFIAIVLHELSHAAVARMNDLPVRSITLFALGGVAQIEKEAPSGTIEFWLGIVGPITSAVIGSICLGISYLLGWQPMSDPDMPLMAMLVWLGYINIALAAFNMIPGFPMDGGRVLRGIIWSITGDGAKATRIASASGQLMAVGFIVFGLFLFFGGAGFGGLWIAFIGWFLLNAAKASYAQVEVTEGLRGVTVGDLMTRDCPSTDSQENLQTLIDEYLLRTGRRCFMVTEMGKPVGMITPHEIKAIEPRLRVFKSVADVMRPIDSLYTVTPQTPASDALEMIGREGVNQLPVVTDGRLEGIISREQIINYIVTRRELNL
ncbi:MAG TPA: site-2 protease family protein [Pyrinomonadaceae bacterium]